jgi:hypothetical protein
MTEAEWLACEDIEEILSSLHGNASERKMRLFAVACCRSIWHQLTEQWCRKTVELAERFADGQATERERANAWDVGVEAIGLGDPKDNPIGAALSTVQESNPTYDGNTPLFSGAMSTSEAAAYAFAHVAGKFVSERYSIERRRQIEFLRDIFGNPFRPVTVDPAWQSSNVVHLAQSIYDDRTFDRMPILADALEDAGCSNQDILQHCRSGGEHVRGCWVVDLLLGKS